MTMTPSILPQFDLAQPLSWEGDTAEQLSMRQLRHQTKNALQGLLNQVAMCSGLQQHAAGRALARDLERRILLSAGLSDALFGFTATPRSIDARLDALGRAVIGSQADVDQEIAFEATVLGRCPAAYDDIIVRVAHELIVNAVKHGMTLRMVGRIEVLVDARDGRVGMTVSDDGWGLCDDGRIPDARGDGLRIAELLAAQLGGTVTLHRDRCRTHAMLRLPAGVR